MSWRRPCNFALQVLRRSRAANVKEMYRDPSDEQLFWSQYHSFFLTISFQPGSAYRPNMVRYPGNFIEWDSKRNIFLVYSVTPFKIDQNKKSNRSIEVQNLGNERRYIYKTKTLAKIQVRGIFCIRDLRGNVLPKLIEICMETPCWCSPE